MFVFQMRARLGKLREASLIAPNLDGNLTAIVKHVCKWKWEMSAGGFFVVDRTVLAGVSFLFS